jgi:hypothetical protein
MKDTPQTIEAKLRAGYRPPAENPLVCKKCGAIRERKPFSFERYFCRRHGFYVNSCGYCPFFSTDKYVPPNAPKPSPYKQLELF